MEQFRPTIGWKLRYRALDVTSGGFVNDANGYVGYNSGSSGTVSVSGAGSHWNNSNILTIGYLSTGVLDVTSGGVVSSADGYVGNRPGSSGTVTVSGTGSQWNNSDDLFVGYQGAGNLTIENQGLVTVGGNTTIGTNGAITLDGGRFEFGTMSLTDYHRISSLSGSLKGYVSATGINHVDSFSNPTVDTSEVIAQNGGILYGSALLDGGLHNLGSGELRTLSSDWVRFGGNGSINEGRINNFGGVVEFGGDLTNASTGQISGRGVFVASGGLTNQGAMHFSGTTDILGDVTNDTGGLIVTSGNATTSFYDNVVNQGEIRTSGTGSTVFFGDVSGSGTFTGTGTTFFEGGLNPGNSPGVLEFSGDVVLGSESLTTFELGGLNYGEFDKLIIGGDLTMLGSMSVEMWNGFGLAHNMEFLIIEVGGNQFGNFSGFGEGDLVGNFGGFDLFISYAAGDGNDVALFTAVPEPGAISLVGMAAAAAFYRRRRKAIPA
ncbi:MAG: PEP-CTERM sorting domain-containing protein [Pirellulaceae bacterium]